MASDAEFNARIAAAASRWLALRDRCRALREERAGFLCRDQEEALSDNQPCWRTYVPVVRVDAEPLDRAEWCQPCLDRQKVHDELVPLVRSRGAALRNLIRIYRESALAVVEAREVEGGE